ncbi:MAG: plasmid partitioning protein RepB [Cypionkella sp.]
MARKNMFEGITPTPARPEDPAPTPRTTPRMPEVFQQSGPIAAIRNDLRSMGARSIQEIDPDQIEDTGHKDRLGDLDGDIAELRDSIARHGQQVPILLRPHPTLSGRYQVVYGRRRLAAIRGLGTPVKALIRTLSDEEAVLAQGQENNFRKDPSFIEKALFAGDLEEAGYDARVIQEALNVSRSHTSHMRKVREAFPRALIEKIGAAPSVGWKRWYDLSAKVLERGIDANVVVAQPFPADLTSDQRFDLWVQTFETRPVQSAKSPAPKANATEVRTPSGTRIGGVVVSKGKVTFQAEAQNVKFADWLGQNAEPLLQRLHQEYLDQSTKTD